MNRKYLEELLDYHCWAQELTFDAVEALAPEQFTRDMGNSFGSVRDTLVHIHMAECIWYSRWQEESVPMPAASMFPDLASIRGASRKHEARTRATLDRLGQDGINRAFDYTSKLDGNDHSTVFWRMFLHMINHSTYHRGQVTTMLRQLGAKPPQGTDLIQFYWTREK